MNRISLKNMTEEEKKAHKREIHRLHQRKYYEKNKDYYRNYQRNWAKQFNEEIIKLKSQNKSLSAENSYYKHIINELERILFSNKMYGEKVFEKSGLSAEEFKQQHPYTLGSYDNSVNLLDKLKELKENNK